jgi:membrane-bound serine protease (ClpP class)
MSDASLVAVLQIVAAALLLAEIFLPSGGLLGLATAGVLIGSLWVAFGHSAALGWIAGGADLLIFPLLGRWGIGRVAKSPMALQAHLDSGAIGPDPAGLVGAQGVAETGLRPVGRAIFDGIRLEVRSTGRFVEPGEKVFVVGDESGRILVRPLP